MHFRGVFVLGIITVLTVLSSLSIVNAGERQGTYPRARKLANTHWLAAPHFPALSKRGRFVFRDLPLNHNDVSSDDEFQYGDVHPEKRNWRV
jgi:hypothetical protein